MVSRNPGMVEFASMLSEIMLSVRNCTQTNSTMWHKLQQSPSRLYYLSRMNYFAGFARIRITGHKNSENERTNLFQCFVLCGKTQDGPYFHHAVNLCMDLSGEQNKYTVECMLTAAASSSSHHFTCYK